MKAAERIPPSVVLSHKVLEAVQSQDGAIKPSALPHSWSTTAEAVITGRCGGAGHDFDFLNVSVVFLDSHCSWN